MRKDLHWFLLLSIAQLIEVSTAVSDFHHLFLRTLYKLVSRAKCHQRYDQSSEQADCEVLIADERSSERAHTCHHSEAYEQEEIGAKANVERECFSR